MSSLTDGFDIDYLSMQGSINFRIKVCKLRWFHEVVVLVGGVHEPFPYSSFVEDQ